MATKKIIKFISPYMPAASVHFGIIIMLNANTINRGRNRFETFIG